MSKIYKIINQSKYYVLILSCIYSLIVFLWSNTAVVCGSILDKDSATRGGYDYTYSYKVKNIEYLSGHSVSLFKEGIGLDSLQKYDCIEIEYSIYFPSSISRVVDKRVIKD